MSTPRITLSVVSHGHGDLLCTLFDSLAAQVRTDLDVLLTLNIPEPTLTMKSYPFPVTVIHNDTPHGFGANHNAAFKRALGDYFCVLNPDIRLLDDPFPGLVSRLEAATDIGVIAPLVITPEGALEDSARAFPSPLTILLKALELNRDRADLAGALTGESLTIDWVAGMFMLIPARVFAQLEGFDEGYFLYYEDVDLCSRINAAGMRVEISPSSKVIHDARRESHRNLKYLRWHLGSMMRFFVLHSVRQLTKQRRP